jgi:predicted phosphodiesterase
VKASIKRQIADDLLTKFPNAPTRTLARMAYKDNPSVWSTAETTRRYFRECRGASGERVRRVSTDKSHFRTLQKQSDPFGRMPKPLREFEEWSAVQFDGPLQALIIADLHIPYYDKDTTTLALKYGKSHDVDTILLNGDIADFFSVSFWENDPRKRDFPQEVRDVKDFLRVVRDLFPKARIIFKLGNHEERLIRYMRVKAPELLGLPEFEIESVLGLSDNDIQLVKDNKPIRLGKLNVLHGHEIKFAISNPVNPARGLFLRGKASSLCSHFHQTSQHSERTVEQKILSCWSTGCLSDLHPEYRPINNWNLGFCVVGVDNDGAFEVSNLRVINGTAYT